VTVLAERGAGTRLPTPSADTMKRPIHRLVLALCLMGAACSRVPAQTRDPDLAHDEHANAAAMRAMGGEHGNEALHVLMSAPRPPAPGDSARAAAVVAQMRTSLARYRDVREARRDGFVQFLPGVDLPVYHFTRRMNALEEAFRFDPAKPTSLLYRRQPNGGLELIGAMYTAPRRLSEESLNERIPLSVARWHKHVDWCVPPRGQAARWRETQGGQPRFGPQSPIHTREACEAAGGRFLPHLFGWMVHVNAFASTDPHTIWDPDHHHAEAGMDAHAGMAMPDTAMAGMRHH
jgi:hypothetical protein